MATDETKYVWYAAYGSNLSWGRFRCYLEGGIPPYAQDGCPGNMGCEGAGHAPLESRVIEISHQLYFALPEGRTATETWGAGGVAFIRPQPHSGCRTICRIWLIGVRQYACVKAQEGSSYSEDLLLRFEVGHPVRTVTHPVEMENLRVPSWSYLKTIAIGLRETYALAGRRISDAEIVAYLADKPGIKNVLDRSVIEKWVVSETRPDGR
jgi:hypothetical protein